MPVRKDPFESGRQRIQEGLTELLELTEPLDAYRERLRSQIKHVDQNKDVSRHRVVSAFSRITKLIQAKEQEILQRLDVLCDEAKSKAGEKLRETASVAQETSKASAAASALLQIADKQSFFTQFSSTSQTLQQCLDDLLLFSSEIPKEDSDSSHAPQLVIIEKECTELCQRVSDMLIPGLAIDTEAAAVDKLSSLLETKQHADEEMMSSLELSSPVFTFSPSKPTRNFPSEIKTVSTLPQSGVATQHPMGPMPVSLCWPPTPHPTVLYPQSPTMMAGPLVPQYPHVLDIQPMHVARGFQMQVTVTEAVSPSSFWIQRRGQQLTQLMERLCVFFSVQPPVGPYQALWCPAVGGTCAACFSVDRQWYRARAIGINSPAVGSPVPRVQVLYVDYGNREEVPLYDIRSLNPEFLSLPAQAMHCSLCGLQPEGPDLSMWSNAARSWFVQAIVRQNLLVTVIKPPVRDEPASVDLHAIFGDSKLSIGNMMINSGLAQSLARSITEQSQKQPQSHIADSQPATQKDSLSPPSEQPDDKPNCPRESKPAGGSEAKSDSFNVTVLQRESSSSVEASSPRKIAVAKRRRSSNSSSGSGHNQTVAKQETAPGETLTKLSFSEFPTFSLGSPVRRSFTAPSVSCGQAAELQVMVSHVENPGRFYVHIIGDALKEFDSLMHKLNEYCSREVAAALPSPKLNEPCAVMFREDRRWCRAAVVGVQSNEVCVNYVDYGNRQWIDPSDVYCLPEQFLDLPKQAVECMLADVCPHETTPTGDESESEGDFEWLAYTVGCQDDKQQCQRKGLNVGGMWKKTATELFEKLTGQFRVLFAKVVPSRRLRRRTRSQSSSVATSPVMRGSTSSSPPFSFSFGVNDDLDPILHLHLYDTTAKNDVYINQLLVDANFADSWTLNRKTESLNQDDAQCDPQQDNSAPPILDTSSGPSSTSSLEDVFSEWDPMKSEYESARNTYQVNPDDTNVALHGIERQEDRKYREICRFYARGMCRRGDNCSYRHVKYEDISAIFWSENFICLPSTGSWVPVTVTAITHPHMFWVQLPQGPHDIRSACGDESQEKNGEKFAEMMDRMQKICNSQSRFDRDIVDVSVGEWVCACSKRDKQWYRATVVDGSKADGVVKVFWVDFGDCEYVPEDCLQPMRQEFQHLPFQGVECLLIGVKPLGSSWSQDARELLHQLTVGKLLCAHVRFRLPGKLFVSLYDSSADGKDVDIGQLLIDAGVAQLGVTADVSVEKSGQPRTVPG